MGRETKIELNDDLTGRRLSGGNRGVSLAARPRVGDVMTRDFVSLPPWFPAEKAAQVLRQTGKSFALLGAPGGAQQVATLPDLVAAPPTKSLAWCARALGPGVALDTDVDEAIAVMDRRGLDRVAVVMGRLLVGIVTREAADERAFGAPVAGTYRLAA